MSAGQTRSGPPLGLEKFMGREGEYTMWRDKALTHIRELDQVYERGLLEKDQTPASVLMVDFLDGHPEKPIIEITKEMSKEEAKEMRWRHQHWTRANSGMQNLFNQSLTNMFISGLPDQVSNMRPCDIWKELELKYGVGDAAGVIEVRRQWDRITAANWNNLGTLFAQLKKLRNDMNRKMIGLVGKEMVTEHWLCMEVLALLPSEFWGSSVSLTEEWFTIENVELSLRRVFGDRSKKEIAMLTDKRRPVTINVARKFTGKKRTQDDVDGGSSPSCFYCFGAGHRKRDGSVMAKDRDPKRPGGQLFRSNIRSGPSMKKKRVMAVKKGTAAVKSKSKAPAAEMNPADAHAYDQNLAKAIEEADEFEFKETVPVSDGGDQEDHAFSLMDIDAEGLDTQ